MRAGRAGRQSRCLKGVTWQCAPLAAAQGRRAGVFISWLAAAYSRQPAWISSVHHPGRCTSKHSAHAGHAAPPGRRPHLVSVMLREEMHTGLKERMRGYRSMGDRVPLVITTVWYFANTGRIASEASRQLSWMTGSGTWGEQGAVRGKGGWRGKL